MPTETEIFHAALALVALAWIVLGVRLLLEGMK